MAVPIPISAMRVAQPITTIAIPIKPKSDGVNSRVNTSNCTICRIPMTAADVPENMIPVNNFSFNNIGYFFCATTMCIQVHSSALSSLSSR